MRFHCTQPAFVLFLKENICCDPSLEPSGRLEPSRPDSSNDGSQNMFLWRNMAIIIPNYPCNPFLS